MLQAATAILPKQPDFERITAYAKDRLRERHGNDVYDARFATLRAEAIKNHVLLVSVPTTFLCVQIGKMYQVAVFDAFYALLPDIEAVQFYVRTPKPYEAPVPEVLKLSEKPPVEPEEPEPALVEPKELEPPPAEPKQPEPLPAPRIEVPILEGLVAENSHVFIKRVIHEVAQHFDVTVDDITGPKRGLAFAWPRQICMYIARMHTKKSLTTIAKYFGGRDHTTVLHAMRKVRQVLASDPDVQKVITDVVAKLKGGGESE